MVFIENDNLLTNSHENVHEVFPRSRRAFFPPVRPCRLITRGISWNTRAFSRLKYATRPRPDRPPLPNFVGRPSGIRKVSSYSCLMFHSSFQVADFLIRSIIVTCFCLPPFENDLDHKMWPPLKHTIKSMKTCSHRGKHFQRNIKQHVQ